MTDETLMARWFIQASHPHLNRYNQRMADAAPYRNAPRWERERAAALDEYTKATSEAASLYRDAMFDLEKMGEISETTNDLLTQFNVSQIMKDVAA